MRFDGREVRTRGDDWIEVQTEDGPAVLRGYDPALIEYETLDEAKDEKMDEMQRAFAAETEAELGTTWEALAVMASDPRDARITALKTRLTKLRQRVGAVEAASTATEVEGVVW